MDPVPDFASGNQAETPAGKGPVRWLTVTQNWRHERMTGRPRREHDRVASRFEV
jgi:hypothetical protein